MFELNLRVHKARCIFDCFVLAMLEFSMIIILLLHLDDFYCVCLLYAIIKRSETCDST